MLPELQLRAFEAPVPSRPVSVGSRACGSAFLLLRPETDEEHPRREHRAEQTEDDARCNQIGAAESVEDEPKPSDEDQPSAELTEDEPNKSVARDTA